ncbi:MAG: FAD-dependent oxidoreductase [Kutzneria sp.]|nr:FAD-dependent oxidoreductase [Kutzneria sp.]
MRHIVVVGAGAAGLTAAETLRREGYTGALTLVGDEKYPPYDRPPLSKQVLGGQWDAARTRLRSDEQLANLDMRLLTGCPAVGLNLDDRTIELADGDRLGFDGLIIATGVRPRTPPWGHDMAGVHVLRGLDDTAALRAALLAGPRTVVIGAGFLGTEVAATARSLGVDVTVVDPLPTPMIRQLGEQVGKLVATLHQDNGVRMLTGVGVRELDGNDGRVRGVLLADGTRLATECVLVAIGSVPATDWLASSSLPLGDGIECDSRCQAAPGVYAAGDVASWTNTHFGVRMRLEHRMNATEQGVAAARNLLGANVDFTPIPYFWTDQFDAKIQSYGVIREGAEFSVVTGDPEQRRFTGVYAVDGVVTGVLGWNCPKETRGLRQLIVDRASVPGRG